MEDLSGYDVGGEDGDEGLKESWMSDNQERVLTVFFLTKKQVAVTLTLWGYFKDHKKFTVQKCGCIEENQRRAHDFQWLARKKIKEARRQNEVHQRVGEKHIYNAFTNLSKGIKPPKGSVPLNRGGRNEMKIQTIKILNRPYLKPKALVLIRIV